MRSEYVDTDDGSTRQRTFLSLNIAGGLLVLASYVWGTLADGAVASGLWGGVPEAIRPLYTVNMLLSATGYFLFAPYIAFRIDSSRRDFLGHYSHSIFFVFMLLVLLPSAAWLPLTAWMLSDPSDLLWWLIRIDLALVAIGSLGLLATLVGLRSPYPPGRGFAVLGLVPFCIQTVVLDALVWPVYFGS